MNEHDAISELRELVNLRIDKTKGKIEHDTCIVGTKLIYTLLYAYKKKEVELYEKNKIIQEMAEEIILKYQLHYKTVGEVINIYKKKVEQ